MKQLLEEIKKCTICKSHLPRDPKPIVTGNKRSKIIIISQAPGTKAHASGIPWDDPSGKKLKQWLNVSDTTFYNAENFAVLPMGFCYPGKAKTGDLPPRKECAPLWHDKFLNELTNVKLVLLVGAYAQKQYLKTDAKKTLTETVSAYAEFLPKYFPLPHPSPVNRFWRSKNPWFEARIVPELQKVISNIIDTI